LAQALLELAVWAATTPPILLSPASLRGALLCFRMGCSGSKDASGAQQKNASAAPADKDAEKKQKKEENRDYGQALQFLGKVNLLKRLPRDMLPMVAEGMQTRDFNQNDAVVKQGEMGQEFFVIRQGEAKVTKDGVEVATLKQGDYFGEMALLREDPRAATVSVISAKLQCFVMHRKKFEELKLTDHLQFANRNAVGAGKVADIDVAKPPTPKTAADKELIKQAFNSNATLSSVVSLDQGRVDRLIEVAWTEDVAAGTEIVKEGDAQADFFYIVNSGEFEVSTTEDTTQSAECEKQILANITTGGSFGELALLYLTPRAATVKATKASVVWVIDRRNFKNILMQVSDRKVKEYLKLLDGVRSFDALITAEKEKVAQAMVEMHYSKDETIIQQGEAGSTFYILYEGDVGIIVDNAQVEKMSVTRGDKPQYFGEKALTTNEKRAATVKVLSETAKALALDKRTYDVVLKPLAEVLKPQEQDKGRTQIKRQDLSRIGLLGCGGFGAVELYEHKSNGQTYAMKALSKGYIVKTGMQESVMNEKNILLMTNSDFIIKLYETYNGQQSLYFLMEVALGGELYATYNRKGLHGSDKHAKYYISGTIYAFEHVHERHIIYRDLKPENLLLTDKGHIKLTDMGLAKFVVGKTFTTCGTPDYFAPEIIASTGHTNAVDWWTLGILLFELLSGRPPFESAYPMQTYSKVMKGIGKVSFPSKCTGTVEPLIKGLLKREPAERLPMRPGGTDNVKTAKWYEGFDWQKMKAYELDAPYKPMVKSKKDIANFSARKEDMPKQLEYKDDGSGWDKDFATL